MPGRTGLQQCERAGHPVSSTLGQEPPSMSPAVPKCFVERDGAEVESVPGDKLAFSQAHSAASVHSPAPEVGGCQVPTPPSTGLSGPAPVALLLSLVPCALSPQDPHPSLESLATPAGRCPHGPTAARGTQLAQRNSAFLYKSPSPNRHTPVFLLRAHSVTPTTGNFVAPNDPAAHHRP